MNGVGIANILEKKYYTINGEQKVYYEMIDCAYGFICDLKNDNRYFICLSGDW